MNDATTELLARLVAIDSVNPALVPGGAGEAEIASFVAGWGEQAGLGAEVLEATRGRPSVIVRAPGQGGGRTLLLCGHLDTVNVEGMTDPHVPRVDGDRLAGRGSYDMKAGLAAALIACREAAALDLAGDVVVAAVADEEHASLGIQEVLAAVEADLAVVTEPTEMALVVAHRGFVWSEVEVHGRAAHGSRPHLGVDAIVKAGPVLTALGELDAALEARRHPLLGRPSVHSSTIRGGEELSSYPGRCVVGIERRTLPGESGADVEAELEALLDACRAADEGLVGFPADTARPGAVRDLARCRDRRARLGVGRRHARRAAGDRGCELLGRLRVHRGGGHTDRHVRPGWRRRPRARGVGQHLRHGERRARPHRARPTGLRVRAVVNNAVRPEAVDPPSSDPRAFHASLPGYRPTPERDLRAIADELGLAEVRMKDESDRLGLPAFKILGASWAVARTLEARPDVSMLVAASAGNHGRAVARVAALRGLRCRVFLPARAAAPRRAAIAGEGAEVVVVDGSYEDAVAAAAAAGAVPGVAEIADVGTSDTARWVIDGYATLFAEVAAHDTYDVLIVPIGVGSLGAAAARFAAHVGAKLIGVEPVTAACLAASLAAGTPTSVPTPGTTMAGLDCAEVSAAAWPTLRDGVHGTIAVTDAEADAAVRELAAAGFAIGESGAAPLAALRALVTDDECAALCGGVGLGERSRVLLVATEGPTRAGISSSRSSSSRAPMATSRPPAEPT